MAKNKETIISSKYAESQHNTSFSGADIIATFTPAHGKPQVFAEIQTVSYSIYRPMTPVYTLGRIGPKGMVRGQRMIAGSLIFTVFDRHALKKFSEAYTFSDQKNNLMKVSDKDMAEMKSWMKTDEMPPFDINITFMNEMGSSSTMNIYGVHIISEGQTMSIEDMITENTLQYVAMDIDLMHEDANAYSRAWTSANPLTGLKDG
jgi:hypothetical protein